MRFTGMVVTWLGQARIAPGARRDRGHQQQERPQGVLEPGPAGDHETQPSDAAEQPQQQDSGNDCQGRQHHFTSPILPRSAAAFFSPALASTARTARASP